ncbi:MAG TPA: class I SAM-dependent methyltransferase [Sphingomicrobium sp.]|nr:class I SAM-dependent methyltransferase [Sphingomicrobium sp.]
MVTDQNALFELLCELKSRDYRFTCVTPATHERVLSRALDRKRTLADIFGWNRPFRTNELAPELVSHLQRADCLEEADGHLRSLVRVASLDDDLYLHSAFPTIGEDAVFFGPDTYRFVRFVRAHIDRYRDTVAKVIDMGSGSGVGGINVARSLPNRAKIKLVDINPAAGQLAAINARFAEVEVEPVLSDKIDGPCDLVIANPPYIMDPSHRLYRDGGSLLGGAIAARWTAQALDAVKPGGAILLYTGASIVDGVSPLLQSIEALCCRSNAAMRAEEIDPDVFGEELESADYREVERIAVFGIEITKLP